MNNNNEVYLLVWVRLFQKPLCGYHRRGFYCMTMMTSDAKHWNRKLSLLLFHTNVPSYSAAFIIRKDPIS